MQTHTQHNIHGLTANGNTIVTPEAPLQLSNPSWTQTTATHPIASL